VKVNCDMSIPISEIEARYTLIDRAAPPASSGRNQRARVYWLALAGGWVVLGVLAD
jgi:hypothetical protein